MLSRLVVHLYPWIIEIYLWLALLIAGVVGYFLTVPLLNSTGAILENEAAWQIYGALFFAAAAFLSAAAVIGPFLMLVDIRKSIKASRRRISAAVVAMALYQPKVRNHPYEKAHDHARQRALGVRFAQPA